MPTLDLSIPDADLKSEHAVFYLDGSLRFAWGNKAFDRFALENNDSTSLAHNVHGKLMTELMAGPQRARWEAIYKEITAGRIGTYRERFECPSPSLRRSFTALIERVEVDGKPYLRHETRLLRQEAGGPAPDIPQRTKEGFIGRLRYHGLTRSPEGASGDAYWVRGLEDGRVALLIADAMGSGVSASGSVSRLLDILEELSIESPLQAVRDANKCYLHRTGGTPGFSPFVTGILMIVDPERMTLEAVCFGHHGVIITPEGLVEIPAGLPVGILEEERWPVTTLNLRRTGSRLLAYTDGALEQFNLFGAMYGDHRLIRDFRQTVNRPLDESLAAIFHNLDLWRGDAIVKDDQTLLAFEIEGPPGSSDTD